MFFSTFFIGKYPMNWIDKGIILLSDFLSQNMTAGPFKDLLIDGVISGVGSVLVFLPNILILFLFISIFEDTGYMSRAVFIMDKIMHKVGLHGKSFIPLLIGFGCNVPAIMSTRIIENKNNRIATMLIVPFMSCSARLPVYLLIIGAFFSDYAGTVLFLVYLTGILLAVIVAIVLNKFVFVKENVPFVMELPPYRIPTFISVVKHMWTKAGQYLKKMGGVILVAVVIIWTLSNYPHNKAINDRFDNSIATLKESSLSETDINNQISAMQKQKKAELQEQSYLGRLGHFIEPVISPLGFDWRMGVALFTGIAAKEVVVSTLGVIYQVDDDSSPDKLSEKIKSAKYDSGVKKGQNVYSPIVAISFLAFILIYFPCVAVIASISRESGSYKWGLFSILFTTSLAWVVSFVIFQLGSIF